MNESIQFEAAYSKQHNIYTYITTISSHLLTIISVLLLAVHKLLLHSNCKLNTGGLAG